MGASVASGAGVGSPTVMGESQKICPDARVWVGFVVKKLRFLFHHLCRTLLLC